MFGGLSEDIIHEDDALAFRSSLAGELVYINEPLVKYRLHGSNVYFRNTKRGVDLKSLEQQEARYQRDFRSREIMHKAFLLDLEKAKSQSLIGNEDYEKVVGEATRLRRRFSLMSGFLGSGFFGKCRTLSLLRKEGLNNQESKFLFRHLIPQPLFLRIRLARHYADLALNRCGFRGSSASTNN